MSRRGFPTATLTTTALLLAMGVALPLAFHAFPLGGRIFLPMHLPTFVAGLVLGPVAGLVVGVGSPILSALVTGRPPVFYMVPMVFELATYGVVSGFLRPWIESSLSRARSRAGFSTRARPSTAGIVLSLACAMVVGRAVWLVVVVWMAPLIGIQARTVAVALAALGAGWMGAAIQLVLIPAIVRAIERLRNP